MTIQKGVEALAGLVRWVRGERVMLDADLARLYGVETKGLKRAVTRNRKRFPGDFVFILTRQDVANLRCQIGTSSLGWGGTRYAMMAFTEQGVAMLSSVLRSDRAADDDKTIFAEQIADVLAGEDFTLGHIPPRTG